MARVMEETQKCSHLFTYVSSRHTESDSGAICVLILVERGSYVKQTNRFVLRYHRNWGRSTFRQTETDRLHGWETVGHK